MAQRIISSHRSRPGWSSVPDQKPARCGPSLSSRTTPGIGIVVPKWLSRRFYLQQALFVQMRQAYQGCLLERLAIVFRRAGVTVIIKNLFDCIFTTAESDKLGRLLRQMNDLDRLAGARYCRYPAASIFGLGHLLPAA